MKIVMSFRKGAAMWLLLVGVVLVIVGLLLSLRKAPLFEGLADTSSIVMVALAGTTNTYFADQGLTNLPNWKPVSGGLQQISGSMGRFMGVMNTTVYYGTPSSSLPGSTINWTSLPLVTATQVSFDYPLAVIVGTDKKIKYVDDITRDPSTAVWKTGTQITTAFYDFKYVAVSLGRGYAIGTNDRIYYVNNIRVNEWVDVTGSLSGTFVRMDFDGDEVVAVDNAGTVYYANKNIETTPNWKALPGQKMKQVSLKNHMAAGVGLDNNTYFATSASAGNWVKLATPVPFAWTEILYPTGANMITDRPAVMTPCRDGFEFFNGQCLPKCRSNYTTDGIECKGVAYNRTPVPVRAVPQITFTCPANNDLNILTTATCKSIPTVPSDPGDVISTTPPQKEVFTIKTGNTLTRPAAQARCELYGATLATRAQVTAAHAAGASWCSCAWTSDDPSPLYPITAASFPNAPIHPGCGGPTPGIKMCAVGSLAQANCYGVKPPQGLFTDIEAFNNIYTGEIWRANVWNQAPQCSTGFTVATAATCTSKCPTGSTPSGSSCVYASTPKQSQPTATPVYTCPAGYGVSPTNNAICQPICPSGYTSNGTACVATITKDVAIPPRGTYGPAGWIQRGFEGDGAARYYKPCSLYSTTSSFDGTRSIVREVSDTTCQDIQKLAVGTTPSTMGPVCPPTWTKTGNTCFKPCESPELDIGNNRCERPADSRGVVTTATPVIPSLRSLCDGTQDFVQPTTCPTPNTTNYICPAGLAVPPGTATCTGSDCGKPNTCSTVCPPNTTQSADGKTCVGNTVINPNITTGTYICRGVQQSQFKCYDACPNGSTDLGPSFGSCKLSSGFFVSKTYTSLPLTCPPGWNRQDMREGNVNCVQACATSLPGTTEYFTSSRVITGECQYLIPGTSSTTLTRITMPATYLAPCPAQCLPKCKTRELPDPSTASTLSQCTPLAYNRNDSTTYDAIYKCDKTETVENGVCVSKCPDGTYPDGELCVDEMKVVSAPSSIKCTSSAYLTGKKWLCDTSDMAAALLKDPSPTTTYVAADDQVCVADDASTGMYYCESGADAKAGNGTLATARNSHTASCARMKKNYLDLNNTIKTLSLTQAGVSSGQTKVADAVKTLDEILRVKCPTPLPNDLCNKIRNGSGAIKTDATSIESLNTSLTSLVTEATKARDSILKNITSLQCPERTES